MRKTIIWSVVIIFAILGLSFYWFFYNTYSLGNRSGLLQKFSHRGNIFKTYEGELILSSIKSNQGVGIASEKFFFSVADETVAKKLENLQGRNVTVHYVEKRRAIFWRGDSNYIVDSVREE
jgi:hypothetical protein